VSRPEKGFGLEYGEKDDGVREESEGWMIRERGGDER